jgi:hypothetical protein
MTIEFKLPEGFSGTVTVEKSGKVSITGDIAVAAVSGSSSAAPSGAFADLPKNVVDAIEDLLGRHKSYDPSTHSREMAEFLVGREWGVKPHEGGKYLRFVYPGKKHEVSLYLSSKDLTNSKKQQRDFMSSLPGADVHNSDVRVPISDYRQAVANVEAIEAWADTK